jgi:hypothetical protein
MKFEVYFDGKDWLAKRSLKGMGLEAAMALAKELNAAKGRLIAEAVALARAWRVGEAAAAYAGGMA